MDKDLIMKILVTTEPDILNTVPSDFLEIICSRAASGKEQLIETHDSGGMEFDFGPVLQYAANLATIIVAVWKVCDYLKGRSKNIDKESILDDIEEQHRTHPKIQIIINNIIDEFNAR